MRSLKPKSLQLVSNITMMSYHQLFVLWSGLVLGFAIIYTALSLVSPMNGPTGMEGMDWSMRFWNSLYFSTVTASSVGYGDIVPLGISKIFAAIQSVISFAVFAVLVTKLVSNQQEIALREVHKLSYEDIFHNSRSELFVVRKDFDRMIAKVSEKNDLTDDDWEDLAIAYRLTGSIVKEIPDFYDKVHHLYTIDATREELMHEAVHRTLHRINQLLDVMSSNGIDWISHEESVAELRETVRILQESTKYWHDKSPYGKEEAFEKIFHLTESIHAHMTQALPITVENRE